MNVERAIRMIGGGFVLASVLLGMYVHPGFLWFTVFVGANLFQSSLTNWCPMMNILQWAGLQSTAPGARGGDPRLRDTAECSATLPQSR